MAENYNDHASVEDNKECRCSCGQLMAIQTVHGLEIKCKRCKQVTFIPFKEIRNS